jgi:hypothetical protein
MKLERAFIPMISGARQLVRVLSLLFLSWLFWLPNLSGQTSLYPAFQAFEALRAAEDSGADISNLVSQYNNLLQQQAPASSYNTLKQLAGNAQASSLAARNFNTALTIILVPAIALLLTLTIMGALEFRRRLARDKLLDMEIRQE